MTKKSESNLCSCEEEERQQLSALLLYCAYKQRSVVMLTVRYFWY